MDLFLYFKSVLDQDRAPVVLCGLDHIILYMNPAAGARYAKQGGMARVVDWFAQSKAHDLMYTYRNDKENKDVYMVALRDGDGTLIGYYEKHEYRDREAMGLYEFAP